MQVTTPLLFKLIPAVVHLGVLLRWFPADSPTEVTNLPFEYKLHGIMVLFCQITEETVAPVLNFYLILAGTSVLRLC